MNNRVFTIETYGSTPYVKMDDLSFRYKISKTTVRSRVKEMQELAGDRYKKIAFIEDGNIVLVNEFAFLDWMSIRKRWQNKNARKYVDPFRPSDWVEYCGYASRPIREEVC